MVFKRISMVLQRISMVGAGHGWPGLASAGPGLAGAGQGWPRLTRVGQDWPRAGHGWPLRYIKLKLASLMLDMPACHQHGRGAMDAVVQWTKSCNAMKRCKLQGMGSTVEVH